MTVDDRPRECLYQDRLASPDYFQTMDVRLEDGRFFDEHDGRDRRNVVIVNETFARTFWHDGRSRVGRWIKGTGKESPWMTVVGLVRNVRHYGRERPMRPGIYQPLKSLAQVADSEGVCGWRVWDDFRNWLIRST